jgi:CRP-like cAMP-binding protein
VLSVAKPRVYEEGATIVTQGQPGDEMFIIIEGHLVVESSGMKIAELGPGGHFGEMALVDSSPRSATVKARTRTDVLAIGQTEINSLMRVEPVLGVKVLWNFVQVLSMRLREASRESTLRTPFIE